MGGSVEKKIPKSLRYVFSLCCRAGLDAASVKADFFFTGVPPSDNKIEQKIHNTKVASAEVAFYTVRIRIRDRFGAPIKNTNISPRKATSAALQARGANRQCW